MKPWTDEQYLELFKSVKIVVVYSVFFSFNVFKCVFSTCSVRKFLLSSCKLLSLVLKPQKQTIH